MNPYCFRLFNMGFKFFSKCSFDMGPVIFFYLFLNLLL